MNFNCITNPSSNQNCSDSFLRDWNCELHFQVSSAIGCLGLSIVSQTNSFHSSSSETLQKPLHKSSDTELRAFGVLKGSGAENVLLKAVDPQGKKFKNKQYPWFQCIDRDACYKNLLDPKGQVKYLIVYKVRMITFPKELV